MLQRLTAEPLDRGTERFEPSHLEITSVDVGNDAINIIPAEARARFNLRFNTLHTPAGLEAWLRERLNAVGGRYTLEIAVSGEAFLTEPGPFSELVARAVERVAGISPALATVGGTSDSRFIKDYCPVLDFGLVGATMHKVDEQVALDDLASLSLIYEAVLDDFFAA
jgi:succinyl-diaminopimelate desuccinylase